MKKKLLHAPPLPYKKVKSEKLLKINSEHENEEGVAEAEIEEDE